LAYNQHQERIVNRVAMIFLLTATTIAGFSAARITGEDPAPENPPSEWLGSAETELVFVVNPFNCTLSANDIRRLNAWNASGRVPVRLHIVGAGATDPHGTAAAISDLGVKVTVTRASADAPFEAWGGRFSIPTFVLKRRGKVVLVVANMEPESALDVIDRALGAQY
jgi:hypothetical protein